MRNDVKSGDKSEEKTNMRNRNTAADGGESKGTRYERKTNRSGVKRVA